MLTFRNTNVFFVTLLALLIGWDISTGLPWYVYLIVVFVYSLIVFYGCYFVHSNFFIPIVCAADTTEKKIAISFDDGPAVSYTPQILDLLNQHNTKAAFFCIGNRIEGNEKIVQQLHHDGHLIGNHSFSHHFWFDLFPAKKMLADLQLMDAAAEKVAGIKPLLFRPPYGVTNPAVKKAIVQGGYTPVGWSVRSMDTVAKDEKKLLKKINNALRPGAVFLFHDTSSATLAVLPAFLKCVHESGYQVERLDKMLHLKPYA